MSNYKSILKLFGMLICIIGLSISNCTFDRDNPFDPKKIEQDGHPIVLNAQSTFGAVQLTWNRPHLPHKDSPKGIYEYIIYRKIANSDSVDTTFSVESDQKEMQFYDSCCVPLKKYIYQISMKENDQVSQPCYKVKSHRFAFPNQKDTLYDYSGSGPEHLHWAGINDISIFVYDDDNLAFIDPRKKKYFNLNDIHFSEFIDIALQDSSGFLFVLYKNGYEIAIYKIVEIDSLNFQIQEKGSSTFSKKMHSITVSNKILYTAVDEIPIIDIFHINPDAPPSILEPDHSITPDNVIDKILVNKERNLLIATHKYEKEDTSQIEYWNLEVLTKTDSTLIYDDKVGLLKFGLNNNYLFVVLQYEQENVKKIDLSAPPDRLDNFPNIFEYDEDVKDIEIFKNGVAKNLMVIALESKINFINLITQEDLGFSKYTYNNNLHELEAIPKNGKICIIHSGTIEFHCDSYFK